MCMLESEVMMAAPVLTASVGSGLVGVITYMTGRENQCCLHSFRNLT